MYGKLFESTFSGSMCGHGSTIFAVWCYAIAHVKPDASVEINPRILTAVLGDSLDKIEAALEFLQRADPRSRSKEEDGKRLIREGEFSFRLVNFEAYNTMRNEDERRAYNRRKQAEHRARKGKSNGVSLTVIDKSALSAHADVDADVDVNTEESPQSPPRGRTKAKVEFDPASIPNLNRDAYDLYVAYRAQNKWPKLRAMSAEAIARQLAAESDVVQLGMVQQSIRHAWRGLFDLKTGQAQVAAASKQNATIDVSIRSKYDCDPS